MTGGRFLSSLAASLLVAAAYYLCGRLGLLLAIPPGYATAIWPSSGIALAAMLLAGPRVAPGIWAASFLLNLPAALGAGGTTSFLIPAAIATGATLEALAGRFLIRRFVFEEYRNLLLQEHHVFGMLLLGGPVACLAGAAVGIGTLWFAGRLPIEALAFNAWTWWVGDSIGVLVFTPLVLIWAIRPYSRWLAKQVFVTLPLALLFGVVVAVFVFVSRREEARLQVQFENVGNDVAHDLQKNLNATLDTLSSLEGLFASVDRVERYQFEIFANRLLAHLEGVQGLSWNPVVPAAQRAAFEARMRTQSPGYAIHEIDGEGRLQAARARTVYVPVQHIVPRDANRRSLGFDTASEGVRREALESARDTGQPVVSGALAVLQRAETGPGVLVLMPAYRHGIQPNTLTARRKYLQGYVIAAFRVADVLHTTLDVAAARGLRIRLIDEGANGTPPVLYEDAGFAASTLRSTVPLYFAGRPWRLEVAEPAVMTLANSSWQVWLVLAGGLLITSLVGMLLLTAQGRTVRVEALVNERTAELQKLNSSLTNEVRLRARLENEAAQRANELAEKNVELQRRDDITRELLRNLRRSEAELRRTASRLAASNRELEQFAYVTSHDLKAPLRSIASFAQLLERRHSSKLEGEAREFLDFIADGIRRMQELIDDLLQLSRLDARPLELELVPAGGLVEQACKQLAADIRATGAKLHVGEMPEVLGDARLLTQLLQNLIGNALKFQPPGKTPEIRIDAVEEGDVWHFTIADNGIGIEPQHLDQIFMIFKRLHTQDQYPGTGIGLAVCRKVIQLHGGEIWAESTPGKGTRFHFTLPRKAESPAERAAA